MLRRARRALRARGLHRGPGGIHHRPPGAGPTTRPGARQGAAQSGEGRMGTGPAGQSSTAGDGDGEDEAGDDTPLE
jgi:hypothetical protein